MGYSYLIRRGLQKLLSGDVADIRTWLIADSERKLGVPTTAVTVEPPAWLAVENTLEIVQYPQDEHCFFTVFRAGVEEVSLSFPSPARQVDVGVLAPARLESLSVSGEGVTAEGETVIRTVEFTDHESFSNPKRVSVSLSFDEPVLDVELSTSIEHSSAGMTTSLRERTLRMTGATPPKARLELPKPHIREFDIPIICISIDALRYDQRENLSQLIDVFGDDAVVPTEPRTQGTWTVPSHGSLVTGAHPGEHAYTGLYDEEGRDHPLNPKMRTIPEVLADAGYRCSGIASSFYLRPEYGFGRGFSRYRHHPRTVENWLTRENDSRRTVDTLIRWLDEDASTGSGNLYYFVHVYDTHFPYIPPLPVVDDVDLGAIDAFLESVEWDDYLKVTKSGLSPDQETVEIAKQFYERSVEYTAAQLRRFFERLEYHGLLDEALVIIAGDHGEEWGEDGLYMHWSTNDTNIRPFYLIKPPQSASWDIPEKVDQIDILPTIAMSVGATIPEQCRGTPLQTKSDDSADPRITEYFRWERYQISVELGETKGVFTYDGNYPFRPTDRQVRAGPVMEEFTVTSRTESRPVTGGTDNVSEERRYELQRVAESFINSSREREPRSRTDIPGERPSPAVREQLEDLGYK